MLRGRTQDTDSLTFSPIVGHGCGHGLVVGFSASLGALSLLFLSYAAGRPGWPTLLMSVGAGVNTHGERVLCVPCVHMHSSAQLLILSFP